MIVFIMEYLVKYMTLHDVVLKYMIRLHDVIVKYMIILHVVLS